MFLRCRSRELVPGGRLVVVTMATDDLGDFGYAPLLDAMYAALKDLVADGFMSEDEFRRMVIPTVGRTKAEFAAPFADGGRFEGLTLTDLEIFPGEDRIWFDFGKRGDANAFGSAWARFSRGSVFPTLADALDGPDATRLLRPPGGRDHEASSEGAGKNGDSARQDGRGEGACGRRGGRERR